MYRYNLGVINATSGVQPYYDIYDHEKVIMQSVGATHNALHATVWSDTIRSWAYSL